MYGIKTPDGSGLYKVIDEALPQGVDASRVWPVNDVVPDGAQRTGWRLDAGVVEPILRVTDVKPTFDPLAEKLVAEVAKDATGEIITWTIEPLTPEEQKAAIIRAEAEAIKAEVLDPKGGFGTLDERVARLEKAVASLAR